MQWSKDCSAAAKKLTIIDLQYPTIPVYGTPSSWLSQSQLVTMASSPDDSSFDDTSSSLGDSAYDFVDDKSAVVSEDEDQEHLAQSVSSNEDRESESHVDYGHQHDEAKKSQPSREHSSVSFDSGDALMDASQTTSNGASPRDGDNIIDECNSDVEERDKRQIILLNESRNPTQSARKETEGSYTLKFFEEHEVSETLQHFRMMKPPGQVIATIRQTMVSQRLELSGPYKVIYIGDISAKEPIIRKLGSALATSLGSGIFQGSRFNVVPVSSFGDIASPEVVLIDSTGLEMSVEECVSASYTKMDGGNDTVSMNLSYHKLVESFWSGTEHVVTDHWDLPDLAIFYLAEGDDISAKQTRHFARKFMSRHKIPCVVISQHPSWTKPAEIIALDPKTPHTCLETVCSDSDDSRILKRLPIDLATFLELDAVQVNRNLAYLTTTRHYSKAPSTASRPDSNCEYQTVSQSTKKTRPRLTGFLWLDESRILERVPHVEKLLTSALFLILGLFLYHFSVNNFLIFESARFINSYKAPTDISTTSSALLTKPVTATSVSSHSLPTLTSKPASSVMNPLSAPKTRPVRETNTDIASFLLDRDALLPNKSEKFYIKIIGDYHIVLKAPQWFSRSKRTPKIKFSVVRGDESIKHQISMLFDGIYALEIPREDAYGTLNVSVSTMSKPRINESFELHFGTSWFKSFRWKKAAQTVTGSVYSDLNLVRTGFAAAYNYTDTEIRFLMNTALEKANGVRKGADKIRVVSLNRTAKTTEIILAQTLGRSRNLSRQLGHTSFAASNHVVMYADNICKDIIAYSGNTSLAFSRKARDFSQVASDNIGSSIKSFVESQKKHLRETQKRTLKVWWKIRGLPKRQTANDLPRGKVNVRNVRATKKIRR